MRQWTHGLRIPALGIRCQNSASKFTLCSHKVDLYLQHGGVHALTTDNHHQHDHHHLFHARGP